VIDVASLFGYKRWDIMRPLVDSEPNRLRSLEQGKSVVIDDVEATKTEWEGVTVFVFTPTGSTKDGSGIIYIHGGGWTILRVESYQDLLTKMALETGAVIISPNYKKAPEYPYPAVYDDCRAVSTHFFEYAKELGVDKGRIAMSGDSAGGNLAAAVSLDLANDESFTYNLKYLFLLYPSTSLISYNHRSHLYYKDCPILSRDSMDHYKINYLGYEGNYRVLSALRKNGHLVDNGKLIESSYMDDVSDEHIPDKYSLNIDNRISHKDAVQASSTLTEVEKQHLRSIIFDRRRLEVRSNRDSASNFVVVHL